MAEDYVPLPIKYRPQTFDDLVGQRHNTIVLTNIVKKGDIWPSYIFSGSRGTGKTSTARIFSRAINCLDPKEGNPCGQCMTCVAISSGRSFDVIEMDAASHGNVDDVRELRKQAMFSANDLKYRVFILDEAHMMSREAFNAMLKIVEEPPPNTLFIFATTEPDRIPDTIQSRSMPFTFRRVRSADIAERLRHIAELEGIDIAPAAITLLARHSQGGLRDAIGSLEQMTKVSDQITVKDVESFLGVVGSEVFNKILSSLLSDDVPGAFAIFEDVFNSYSELGPFIRGFVDYVLDLLILLNDVRPDRTDSELEGMASIAPQLMEARLLQIEKILSETSEKMRYTTFNPSASVEISLLRIHHVLNGAPRATSMPSIPSVPETVTETKPQPLTTEMIEAAFGATVKAVN